MKNNEIITRPLRVALYIRVSGDEQKMHGLSLEAQQERLEKYARENGWVIVGTYIDAAKTARKHIHKRTEFMKMIEEVKADNIDILLFCRLDRWFRSVADYYKIVEILKEHNCEWKTIDEDYDTTTANGRLYINVKLSIAQNEADIDGERIDVVFDSKIAHGTVVSGSAPYGYRVNEEKRLEIVPEQAEIFLDAVSYFETHFSKRAAVRYVLETYGVNWCYASFQRMLKDKIYCGIYDRNGRYNDHFCEPLMTVDRYNNIQEITKRTTRINPSGKIYIFTSIMRCAECGHALVGYMTNGYYYYRCNHHALRFECPHIRSTNEKIIEDWIFEHLEEEINKCEVEWTVKAKRKARPKAANDKAALTRKLKKLKELYVNDLIDIEEYKKDYNTYTAALAKIKEPVIEEKPDFTHVKHLLDNDFRSIYDSLEREDKRALWRSVFKEITIDNENNITSVTFQ